MQTIPPWYDRYRLLQNRFDMGSPLTPAEATELARLNQELLRFTEEEMKRNAQAAQRVAQKVAATGTTVAAAASTPTGITPRVGSSAVTSKPDNRTTATDRPDEVNRLGLRSVFPDKPDEPKQDAATTSRMVRQSGEGGLGSNSVFSQTVEKNRENQRVQPRNDRGQFITFEQDGRRKAPDSTVAADSDSSPPPREREKRGPKGADPTENAKTSADQKVAGPWALEATTQPRLVEIRNALVSMANNGQQGTTNQQSAPNQSGGWFARLITSIKMGAGSGRKIGTRIAGAAGGKIGAAIGGIAAFTAALIAAGDATYRYARRQEEEIRRLSRVGGDQAAGIAQLDAGRIQRDIKTARETGVTSRSLTDSIDKFEKQLQPIQSILTNLTNAVVGTALDIFTGILDAVSPITDGLNEIVKALTAGFRSLKKKDDPLVPFDKLKKIAEETEKYNDPRWPAGDMGSPFNR